MQSLVNLASIDPRIQLDIRYATVNNFLGYPVYASHVCYLHQDAAEALLKVQQAVEALGFGLKVWDGYRPLSVQQKMWDLVQDERYISNPAKNKGRHTRGTAVDVTLVDQSGNEVEMPSSFDEFSERAQHNFSGATPAALHHRNLLKSTMEACGFEPYPYEWWHFDLKGWNDDEKYPSLDLPL